MSLRLCPLAPRSASWPRSASRRVSGTATRRRPDEEVAGGRSGDARRSRRAARRRGPARPPRRPPGRCRPARSAARMIASSCSTTTTVLPASRRPRDRRDQAADVAGVEADRGLVEHVERVDQPRARAPTSARPAAPRRPRASAPGGRASGNRGRSGRGSRAGVRTWSRTRRATGFAASAGSSPSRNAAGLADRQGRRRSAMSSPPTLTARASGRSRAPRQSGHGRVAPPAAQEDADVHLVRLRLQPPEEPAEPREAVLRGALDDQARPARASAARTGRRSAGPSRGASVEQVLAQSPRRPGSSRGRSPRRGASSTGRARSGPRSRSITRPNPSHVGQAPSGLL